MASLITSSLLTSSYDNTDLTIYTTASVAPAASRLVLLCVQTTSASTPTVSGGGMTTWTLVKSQTNILGNNTTHVFCAQESAPGSGTVSIDYGTGQTGCAWSISQYANTATGNNGLSAIRQTAGGTVVSSTNTLSVTLAAFGGASNATFGVIVVAVNEAVSQGSGFTQVSENSGATPNKTMDSQFRNDNDTTVDWTWTTNSSNVSAVALELVMNPYPKVMLI